VLPKHPDDRCTQPSGGIEENLGAAFPYLHWSIQTKQKPTDRLDDGICKYKIREI